MVFQPLTNQCLVVAAQHSLVQLPLLVTHLHTHLQDNINKSASPCKPRASDDMSRSHPCPTLLLSMRSTACEKQHVQAAPVMTPQVACSC